MTILSRHFFNIIKILILLLGIRFLYWFIKDAYEELTINPVHFFEDAYMFIRYAKIWHLGYGASWNIGEGHIYGNTSQLHFLGVLLLTSLQNLSDNMVIKLSSWIPALIFIAWLPWFCARHSALFSQHPAYQKYLLWMGIICPLVYWNTPFAYHYLTGMDTSLSILMHLLLIDSVLSYGKRKQPVLLVAMLVFTYLSYLTRPENILATSLFSFLYLTLILKDSAAVKKYIIFLSALLLLDGLVKYLYFGDVVPLAFYSKKSGFIEGNSGAGFSHPLFYFFYFLSTILPFVVSQFFSVRKHNWIKQAVIIGPAILTLGYFFTMMTVMNMKGRYFYPFTPYFIAAAIISFNNDSINASQYLKNGMLILLSLVLWLTLTISQQHSGEIVNKLIGDLHLCDDSEKMPATDFAGQGYRVDTDGFMHMVNVLKDTPVDLRVAMTEHGFIGSQLPTTHIIDMTGLHDPYVARRGFSAKWLFEQKPDLVWMPHWHYTCMTSDILGNQSFRQDYLFYPGLFTWGLALRKDSAHYDLLKMRIEKQVESIYPGHPLKDFEKHLPY